MDHGTLAAATGPLWDHLDVGTLSAIFLAILLTISGLVQRSTQRRQVVVECPNRIDDLWPDIQKLTDRIDEIHEDVALAKKCCDEAKEVHAQIVASKQVEVERHQRLLAAVERVEVKLNGLELG